MNVTDRILGEAMTPRQRRIYKDPEQAFDWALENGQRFPEAEPHIAKDPIWAYVYAEEVIKGRWPEAEPNIAKHPEWAFHYARYVIGGRWPEAEEAIAKSEHRDKYIQAFPDAKDDWILNGWLDWLDS